MLNMSKEIMTITNKKLSRLLIPFAALVLAGFVAGCSSIPDGINPLEWIGNSIELFSNEAPKESKKAVKVKSPTQDDALSDSDAKFPILAKVDQQQKNAFSRSKGLVADIKGRKYAPIIARQGRANNVIRVAPSRPSKITAAKMSKAQPKTHVLSQKNTNELTREKSRTTLSSNAKGQDDFQTRFVNRLAEIRTQAAKSNETAQYLAPTSRKISIETVVVSSSGIEPDYGVIETRYVQSTDIINNELIFLAKPVPPLSDNVVRIATIRFGNGSAKLSSRDLQILAKVVSLKKERGGRIHIVGHASSRTQNTDPINHKMINFRVSAARADVVARELQRLGADRSQLQVDAVSDSAPEFLEVMPTGEAGNRRTEIYLDS